jgi:hypothetical protein
VVVEVVVVVDGAVVDGAVVVGAVVVGDVVVVGGAVVVGTVVVGSVVVDAVVVVGAVVVVDVVVVGGSVVVVLLVVDAVVVVGSIVVVVVLVVVAPPSVYSTWRRGAAAGPTSHATAHRFPVPVTMIASALPLAHPGRPTISCSTAFSSGVCCPGPAAPTTDHDGGLHVAVAAVRGRDDTLPVAVVNAVALSAAVPASVSVGTPPSVSSTVNWIHARTMVAPGGMARPAKRMPTT